MRKQMKTKAILVLENGSTFEGISCGVAGEKIGIVSFYTGVVGYQELITSPSNAGKIIVLTYHQIVNYGVAKKFNESKQSWINGLVIKENSRVISNWQAEDDFSDFLTGQKILAIEAVDTRALMLELRDSSEQLGIISTKDFNIKSLKKKISQAKNREWDFIKDISTQKVTKITNKGDSVVIIDVGITNSLLKQLTKIGLQLYLVPYNSSVETILKISPKAIIISDGPEADKGLQVVVNTIKQILGKVAILGIGTGSHALALTMGAQIKKMKLGHHGVNYPIERPGSLKGEITVQNHSYVIDESSLKATDIAVTWRNINDKSIEGIQNSNLKAVGYQFYPASPGFDEVNPFLKEFVEKI